jgi:hypothetical protein
MNAQSKNLKACLPQARFCFQLSAIDTPDFILEDNCLLDDLDDILWFVGQLTDF